MERRANFIHFAFEEVDINAQTCGIVEEIALCLNNTQFCINEREDCGLNRADPAWEVCIKICMGGFGNCKCKAGGGPLENLLRKVGGDGGKRAEGGLTIGTKSCMSRFRLESQHKNDADHHDVS